MFYCQLQSLSSGCIGQKDDVAQYKGHTAVVIVGYGASCHPMGRVCGPATNGRWHDPPNLLTLKMVATLFPKQKNVTSQLNHKGGHHGYRLQIHEDRKQWFSTCILSIALR